MTAARSRFRWTPFRMTFVEVAEVVFRRGDSWLREHISDYPTFPKPDDDGLFHAGQVKDWVDQRHGLRTELPPDLTALARDRAKNGPRARATSRS